VTNTRMTLCFHFLQVGFNRFLFPKWMLKKVLWRNYKDNLKRSCRSWKRSKRDWKSNRNLQTFCLCNSGLQKDVCFFFLEFIILLFLRNLFRYPNLKELLNNLEKMRKIIKKHWGDITLKSPKDRHVLMSKSVPFVFSDFEKDQ
jgi:hypothetical protein